MYRERLLLSCQVWHFILSGMKGFWKQWNKENILITIQEKKNKKPKNLTHCHVYGFSIPLFSFPLWPSLVVNRLMLPLARLVPKACSAAAILQRYHGKAPDEKYRITCFIIPWLYITWLYNVAIVLSFIHETSPMNEDTECLGSVARLFFQNN